ncbi:MAG TPA: hypothetical protein PKC72_07985 [Chitinophagaceae bacterium]|nr:hypothetical protein [Chitinophagaceae bacterium]
MNGKNGSSVAEMIREYLDYRQKSQYYHKKKNDAEKEYNKLLVTTNGEVENITLEKAEKIYELYAEMIFNQEESRMTDIKFREADEKLKEVGRILFHTSVIADIEMPPLNGESRHAKQVTLSFPNGEVLVV